MVINLLSVNNYAPDRLPLSKGDTVQRGDPAQSGAIEQDREQRRGVQDAKPKAEEQDNNSNTNGERGNKAFFAVDDNKNVVIRIVNADGKVLKQVPPEDYLKMVERMEESAQKLFHKEV